MGEFGLKIRNIKASTIYGYNVGIRDRYDYTDAMFCTSLFSNYMRKIGLRDYKDEYTRDIVCFDFGFGSRSYDEEIAHIKKMRQNAIANKDEAMLQVISYLEEKVTSMKDVYKKMSKDELRQEFYTKGVDITYENMNKRTKEITTETIHYVMLYRNPSKAKTGQVMFINEKLYDQAYDWLTMGIGPKLPETNAKIVELSAYAPLSTSTIVGSIHIPIEDVLILEDQDSFFTTIADIVESEDYFDGKTWKKKCILNRRTTEVKNTLWDGMALIEGSILPDYINGMALLRNHFFKACAFNTNIQQFFKDWCERTENDYNTYEIKDMYGISHKLSSIKMITTNNATKWPKFKDLMGGDMRSAYEYWCERVRADGCNWGVVKTDHPSKLGNVQQMSYQMVNTLPCTYEEVQDICSTSTTYVELLKDNNEVFEKFLRKNANLVNHYEMLADLYRHNPKFADSKYFRHEKSKIISEYVHKLRKGKITVNADNLTMCGNPYALLLHSVGEYNGIDPTFKEEEGTIQCYTPRFNNNEYLGAFRSPHNSCNNCCYIHNVYTPEMERYFNFTGNIIAINNIHTDVQPRLNGADYD